MPDIQPENQVLLTGGQSFWRTNPVPEIGLDAVVLTDGPHGVRLQRNESDHLGLNESEPATSFPTAVGLASTWNRQLLREVGAGLADEAIAKGVGVLLGPGMNLKRDPRCGRNFEYFAEDPYITGELATAYVQGVQGRGVGTSVKHFAANNQETDRMRRDSQVDMRTLRELYLRAFEKVVKEAQPWTVMCSYNKLNGVQVSENHWLLQEVLKDEWGFEGFVVSDWGAVWDRVGAIHAGLDLEMPANPNHETDALAALEDGRLDRARLDESASRIERVLRRAAATVADGGVEIDADAQHALARRAAEQSVVLLSNDGVLPLAPDADVAVIGEFARTPRYQGAGSSRVNPTRLENALDAIRGLLGQDVAFAPGFTTSSDQSLEGDAHAEAVEVARGADVVLMFLGLGENHESEGYDRTTLDLPAEQLALLDDVLAVNPNVVVVLSNGSSVLLPFATRVRAVVEGWLPGQAGGPAIADILFGHVNPSGKLTETIPLRLEDVPSYPYFPGDETGVRYGEGLFVGYRGYDALHRDVAFPFGHGLSYTRFSYSDVQAAAEGNDVVVSVTVTNTGERTGREVVQVYTTAPDSRFVRPPLELKGFGDVELDPGEAAQLEVQIPAEELRLWSTADDAWLIEAGKYRFEVGSSSRDIRGAATVDLPGDEPFRPLTLSSTMAEAMAVPAFAARAGELLGQMAPVADDSDALGMDLARMAASFPLAAAVGFGGLSVTEVEQLLVAVNEEAAGGEGA